MSEEIEEMIRSKSRLVVVQVTEPFLDADGELETVAAAIKQWRADANVVRVDLSLHREWARKYRVHGAPCMLIFHRGELRVRVRGHVNRTRLRAALDRAGLLDPL